MLTSCFVCGKARCLWFKSDALCLIFNSLNNRKQRVKINSSFRSFQNIISRVPQDYLLGPLLFNIFLFCPIEVASYGDDNTLYKTGDCLQKKLCKKKKKPQTLC